MKKIIVLIQLLFVTLTTTAPQRSIDAITGPFYLLPAPVHNSSSSPDNLLRGRPVNQRDDYTYLASIGSYKVHTRPVQWSKARMTCEEEGAHLVIINSIAESYIVSVIFNNSKLISQANSQNVFWIGFHDRDHNDRYLTLDGQTLATAGFDQWLSGEPDSSGNCGAMDDKAKLRDYLSPVQNQSSLPDYLLGVLLINQRDDYTYVAGIGSYKIHTRAVAWNEARITCEEEGGHLAIINSVAEATAVAEIFNNIELIPASINQNAAHIGFHDLYQEGEFVTIHGQSLAKAGYTRFLVGQPDNSNGNENCGSILKNGGLNDMPCHDKLAFICEIPIDRNI